VGGYLVAAGGTVDVMPSSTVENGLFVRAGKAKVDGTVKGPLEVRGGEALINGTVEGDVRVYAGRVSLGERAVLRKDLQYASGREAKIAPGARVFGSVSRLPEPIGDRARGAALVPTLASFFGPIVAGIAVVLLLPGFARTVTTESVAHFGRDALVGGGVLVLLPVAAVLLVVSVVGLPLGMIGGLAYLALLLISRICAGLVLGALVRRLVSREKETTVDWRTAVVGLALLPAVAWVPILGWAAWLALVLCALGSVSLFAYRGLWPRADRIMRG
jgi:cytoskeletal protein CcmA (bactofilin family)